MPEPTRYDLVRYPEAVTILLQVSTVIVKTIIISSGEGCNASMSQLAKREELGKLSVSLRLLRLSEISFCCLTFFYP